MKDDVCYFLGIRTKSETCYISKRRKEQFVLNVINKSNLKFTRIRNSVTNAFVYRSANTFGKSTITERRRICSVINNHLVNFLINGICGDTWLPIHQPVQNKINNNNNYNNNKSQILPLLMYPHTEEPVQLAYRKLAYILYPFHHALRAHLQCQVASQMPHKEALICDQEQDGGVIIFLVLNVCVYCFVFHLYFCQFNRKLGVS